MGEEYARDPGLQFYWLEKVLEKAKAKKQTVSVFQTYFYNLTGTIVQCTIAQVRKIATTTIFVTL
jgi:hypothetical protein